MEKQTEENIDHQQSQPKDDAQEINEIEQVADSQLLASKLEEVANLNNQIEVLQDTLLRTVAESENTRKRLEKAVTEARDYAIFSFAKDLLTVNDNLSRALEHKPKNLNDEVVNVITGVEMTKNELESILKKHGLETLEPRIGDKFDYNIHHAISQVISDEHEQDSIISVMQLGYKIKDRLLRPATVQVTKPPPQ
ncbi:Protein GrpE [Pseudolycoriella hygida]|uniref:GrpE protein homolog n=1 Tax=Pseudolycoriella hygida TaxID=35572 RepID=A0A9Q0N773_9DIPT|nr:Protein GrpE [Pseudolycoriella hygida]